MLKVEKGLVVNESATLQQPRVQEDETFSVIDVEGDDITSRVELLKPTANGKLRTFCLVFKRFIVNML